MNFDNDYREDLNVLFDRYHPTKAEAVIIIERTIAYLKSYGIPPAQGIIIAGRKSAPIKIAPSQ